jgi:5-methylthioadenosine/S-adenosylhomocysteine deaminase
MIDAGLGGAVASPQPSVFLPYRDAVQEFSRIREMARRHGRDLWVAIGPPETVAIPVVHDAVQLARQTGARMTEHLMENIECSRLWHERVKAYLRRHGAALRRSDRRLLAAIAAARPPPRSEGIQRLSQLSRNLLDADAAHGKLEPGELALLRRLARREPPSYATWLEQIGAFDGGFISIHSVWLTARDVEVYRRKGVFINHNPESNAYLASGIAALPYYARRGLVVTLGTDGAASNDRIDMIAAMRLAGHLQKIAALDIPVARRLGSWALLRAATINGARAMGLAHRVGTLEAGKEADIVLLRGDSFELHPLSGTANNLANLIVNSAESRDIHTVISDGEVVVHEGRPVKGDEGELARSITAIRRRAVQRMRNTGGGRVWRESLTVNDRDPALLRYRSLSAEHDRVDLRLRNRQTRAELCVDVVVSESDKAGGRFLSPASAKRFPYTGPVESRSYRLAPGKDFVLRKPFAAAIRFTLGRAGAEEQLAYTRSSTPMWGWRRVSIYLKARRC